MIHTGDCLEILPTLPADSVDSIVTDPPYGLSFMGKDWDHGIPGVQFWREALRVAKPGAFLLAFGGTRTFHRLAVAIEDAGWEMRDTVMWVYAQGFPKGQDVAWEMHKKASIACGRMVEYDYDNQQTEGVVSEAEHDLRFVRATYLQAPVYACAKCGQVLQPFMSQQEAPQLRAAWSKSQTIWPEQPGMEGRRDVEAPARELQGCPICQVSHGVFADGTEGWLRDGASASNGEIHWQVAGPGGSRPSYRPQPGEQFNPQSDALRVERIAQAYRGWNVALKPAWEPIIVARRPLIGTVAENVLRYGTGAINVDAARVGWDAAGLAGDTNRRKKPRTDIKKGAWVEGNLPGKYEGEANSPAGRWPANLIHDGSDEVTAGFPVTGGGGASTAPNESENRAMSGKNYARATIGRVTEPGSAARFFYQAKEGRSERLSLLTCNCETVKLCSWVKQDQSQSEQTGRTSQKRDTSERTSTGGSFSSTLQFGSENTDQSQRGMDSTISTGTSSTTGSKISNSSRPQNTSEYTEDANSETENGISRAVFAGECFQSLPETFICPPKDGRFTGVVVGATSPLLSGVRRCEGCGSEVRRTSHPTQKPVALMRYLVKLVTRRGGVVLDPFMGSGSTGKACAHEGMEFIGIDLSPEYCEIAARRIAAVPQASLLG